MNRRTSVAFLVAIGVLLGVMLAALVAPQQFGPRRDSHDARRPATVARP